jgi:hypothetical protein
MKPTTLAAIMVALALAGCANPKAANDDNFTTALNAYFQTNPACMKTGSYPMTLADPQGSDPAYVQSYVLNKAGLLSFRPSTRLVNSFLSTIRQNIYLYDLTAKAKPYWHADSTQFCYAKMHVDRISNFTEPVASAVADAMMTQVKYTYYLDDVAPWASNPYVRKYLSTINENLIGQRKEVEMQRLVLTNKGWQVWNEADAGNSVTAP